MNFSPVPYAIIVGLILLVNLYLLVRFLRRASKGEVGKKRDDV